MKESNPKQPKRGSNEEANTPNTNDDTRLANPYTLSPFGIETPKRQRGHLHTRVAQAEKSLQRSPSDSAAGTDSSMSSSESVHL